MQNQCICLTCYKQHEKTISRKTGPNCVLSKTTIKAWKQHTTPNLHPLFRGELFKQITYQMLELPLEDIMDLWRL